MWMVGTNVEQFYFFFKRIVSFGSCKSFERINFNFLIKLVFFSNFHLRPNSQMIIKLILRPRNFESHKLYHFP
jgi:hypothetical protein